MDVPTYILNNAAVVNFFGCWPSFHDAEVPAYEARPEADSLSFTLHTWQGTGEVDAKGFFVRLNHALVSFRFTGVHNAEMDKFKSENILFGMEFFPSDDLASFRVLLDSVMDMSGCFSARSGEVISIIPCTPDGKEISN